MSRGGVRRGGKWLAGCERVRRGRKGLGGAGKD
jgi:hypothetical protein